jgi:translation initiation factor IF-2
VSPEDEDRELLESFDIEFGENRRREDLEARPPVVTVMGHVDPWQDPSCSTPIRKTNVVAREAGGITKPSAPTKFPQKWRTRNARITPLSTLQVHEAFTAMRARGAKSTDIAVWWSRPTTASCPQTIEALNHALAAEVPIVVAVNKIDKVGADPTKVRGQLTEYGLVPEEYGGDTMFVDVSAITGVGLDELLEAVILTAERGARPSGQPGDGRPGCGHRGAPRQGSRPGRHGPGPTRHAARRRLDRGRDRYGRVRALLDDHGNNVDEAPPSFPVQVLGLTAVPGAGDSFIVVDDDRMARQIAERRGARLRMAAQAAGTRRKTLDQLFDQLEKGEDQELRLILKGDGAGSVEALEDALSKIDVGDEVSLRVIDRGVGAITETNVSLAAASDAVIVGFNVRPSGQGVGACRPRGRGHPLLLGDLRRD